MGRERNLHLIQNTERHTQRDRVQQAIQDTEREISACLTKYKHRDRYERERVQHAIQNTDKHRDRYERHTDRETDRENESSALDTKTQGLKSLLEMHNRYRDLKCRNTSNKEQNRQMQQLLQLAVATTRQMHMGNSHTKSIA
jgi:hypothetical protein